MNAQPLIRDKRPNYLSHGKTSGSSPPESLNAQPRKATAVVIANQLSLSVTGPPSKHHWKSDSEAAHCEYIGCATSFGFFERRHHCRRCGDIFCSQHCSSYFRLDQDCHFHPKGTLSRGCDTCTTDYTVWTETLKQQATSKLVPKKPTLPKRHPTTQHPDKVEKNGSTSPSSTRNISIKPNQRNKKNTNTGIIPAPSVPTDWQWSTF